MSVTRAEFKRIFTEAVAQEYCHIPSEDAIAHTFSQTFLRKKEKLIKNTQKTAWYWVNTAAKRAAVIVLLMAMLFSAAMSVEAIRDPVVSFFTEVYEKYILVVYEGEGRKQIEYEYGFSQLPDGYYVISKVSNPAGVSTILKGPKYSITLTQNIISSNSGIDNEHGTITQVTVNEMPVLVYEYGINKMIIWFFDGYEFTLTHYGEIPVETLLELIKTIK